MLTTVGSSPWINSDLLAPISLATAIDVEQASVGENSLSCWQHPGWPARTGSPSWTSEDASDRRSADPGLPGGLWRSADRVRAFAGSYDDEWRQRQAELDTQAIMQGVAQARQRAEQLARTGR